MTQSKNTRVPKEPLPRTVSSELFEAWKRLKRKGDPAKMAEEFGLSRVPFDNALNYGHVPKTETADFVNQFFKARLNSEKTSAEELNGLQDAIDNLKTPTSDTSPSV